MDEIQGATNNKDRIRWLLLISPLLVMLLSVAICLFGARNPKKSSRGTKRGGDHRSNSRKIENTSQTVPMVPLNTSQTENKHLVTGTSSRTSRSHILPSDFCNVDRGDVRIGKKSQLSSDWEHEAMRQKRNKQSSEEGRRDSRMNSIGRNLEGDLRSYSRKTENIPQSVPTSSFNISRTVEDKHLVTRTSSRVAEKNEVKFQDAGRDVGRDGGSCSVPDHTVTSDDQHHASRDRGSSRRPFSTGDDTSSGSCLEHEPSVTKLNEHSLEESLQRTFLQKLMVLDISARNTTQDNELYEETYLDSEEENYEERDIKSPGSLNPLDVLCGLLHRSDMILQQQIVSKMSMCQFAVPLLLPSPDRQGCTFMLWSMRDIVKSWRPHSLINSKKSKEDSIVNVPMPVFSFARLGTCSISKSQYLNQVLNPSQQNHNFFVHGNMPAGNLPRKLSNGLVEIFWYFPAGYKELDAFLDPVAVMNLRGNIESHQEQFRFLISVSSGLFIFIEDINENQRNLLSTIQDKTNMFFILNVRDGEVNLQNLKTLFEVLPRQNILVKNKHINDSQVVRKIQSAMKMISGKTKKTLNLDQIATKATKFNIQIDENSTECQKTKSKAKEITDEIDNVNHYKKKTMKLQGDFWKQMSKMEKEMCRMRELGNQDAEEYKSELQAKIMQLQEQQRQHSLTSGMQTFQEALLSYPLWETKVFLKWLTILLDTKGRHHLRELDTEYQHKSRSLSPEHDLQKCDGSLGVEHFLRELGQFYEAEHSKIKDNSLPENKIKFARLPEIVSDLLLDGFPLELIDGDASNIPLQWITDVLTELDKKMGGQCRMRVITVLGVQSTGKSTLLNTMFGLQFPVASGRCTRGAFMTLIKVKGNFQEELNCDFILVIDTEGLKSLELVSLENSYEHDNELATVIVGLSDITIVNMPMENTEEMRDILQIVVHAFLRMKGISKKSSCLFVHQNMSDVSAPVKNRMARQKFLQQLSEMAKVAARMEKRSGINHFSDVINCDIEKDSWYIPGLWYGIPPMASVNSGYSEMVSELRQSILGSLQSMAGKPQNFREFAEWIKSLWNAVKHEKFVFSFRNHLVTEAYNQLCIHYADWEWMFQKNIHKLMLETETLIYNLPYEKLGADLWKKQQNDINQVLDHEERAMTLRIEKYFESDFQNAHLLEMFRRDFLRSVKYLRKQLEHVLRDNWQEAVRIQKEKSQIQAMQAQYIDRMEEKIAEMMERRRHSKYMGNGDALKEFEAMWEETVSTLRLSKLERCHDGHDIFQFKRDIDCDASVITEQLKFQKMHEVLIQRNDPRTCLEMLKPQYHFIFMNMYEKRDECRKKAEQFCELCLKPAITDHINKYLGKEILEDILQTGGPEEFKSRTRLQLVILEKLLRTKSLDQYVEYINDYELFVKKWISAYIAENYQGQGPIREMQLKTLNSLMFKVQQTLNHSTLISSGNLNEFLVQFCKILEKDLVISKNDMKVVLFQGKLNVKEFIKDVKWHLPYLQEKVQQEMTLMSLHSILSQLTMKPQEELFRKLIGCGKQCPFCKAPCEAGGADHKEHFASLHRSRGLGQCEGEPTNTLDHSICTTNVISNKSFCNKDTDWKPHPYKDYRTHYPDWAISPDTAANASDYWKLVLKEFNDSFAQIYRTNPAKIPKEWYKITHHQALSSLRMALQ